MVREVVVGLDGWFCVGSRLRVWTLLLVSNLVAGRLCFVIRRLFYVWLGGLCLLVWAVLISLLTWAVLWFYCCTWI